MSIPAHSLGEHRSGDGFKERTFRINRGTSAAPDYIDLTGASILVQFRSSERSGVGLEFTTEGDDPTISVSNDGTEFSLLERAGADMVLPAGSYTADVDIKRLGEEPKTWFYIDVEIVTDYSRRAFA
jgi:hypothetical protein